MKIEKVPVDDSDEDDIDQASSVGAEENSLDNFTDEGSQLYTSIKITLAKHVDYHRCLKSQQCLLTRSTKVVIQLDVQWCVALFFFWRDCHSRKVTTY